MAVSLLKEIPDLCRPRKAISPSESQEQISRIVANGEVCGFGRQGHTGAKVLRGARSCVRIGAHKVGLGTSLSPLQPLSANHLALSLHESWGLFLRSGHIWMVPLACSDY